MRVALADDSGLFRASLVLLLEASGAEVTAAVPGGAELLAAIRPSPPDAVILDIRMPPTFTDEGIRTAAELRRQHPVTGILVLHLRRDQIRQPAARPDLARRRLPPQGQRHRPADVLFRVAAGEIAIDQSIVARLLSRNRTPGLVSVLNDREQAVLSQMAEGRSNLGIAQQLYLSPRTVEAHVTSIFAKLRLEAADTDNNRVRAVLAFLRSASPAS